MLSAAVVSFWSKQVAEPPANAIPHDANGPPVWGPKYIVGSSTGLGRTQFWIGDVLQGMGFVQVRIHKFGIRRQQARSKR